MMDMFWIVLSHFDIVETNPPLSVSAISFLNVYFFFFKKDLPNQLSSKMQGKDSVKVLLLFRLLTLMLMTIDKTNMECINLRKRTRAVEKCHQLLKSANRPTKTAILVFFGNY